MPHTVVVCLIENLPANKAGIMPPFVAAAGRLQNDKF